MKETSEMKIHSSQTTQIATLKWDEALIKIPNKYSDFFNSFSEEKILVLQEQTEFNQHTIELEDSK